jgi:hypothetical protein
MSDTDCAMPETGRSKANPDIIIIKRNLFICYSPEQNGGHPNNLAGVALCNEVRQLWLTIPETRCEQSWSCV